MNRKSAGNHDARTQREKFIDAAHELGCDENEAAFDATLKRVAPAKPDSGKINSEE